MSIDIWTPWGHLAFLPPTAIEYAVLGISVLLGIVVLIQTWRDSARVSRLRLALFTGLILAVPVVNSLLVIRFSDVGLLPLPGLPARQSAPIAPLLGSLPIAVAGAWLGPGPGLLIGTATGLARGASAQSYILELVYFGAYGFLAGSLLRRPYSGRLSRMLRQPIVAVPMAAAIALPALCLSSFLPVWLSGLSGADFSVNYVGARVGPLLAQALVAGLSVQLAYAARPGIRPSVRADLVPPGARSLFRRQMVLLVPAFLMAVAVLLLVSAGLALRAAERSAIDDIARAARSAASQTPYFVATGESLLTALARDDRLMVGSPEAIADTLQRGTQTVPFFEQLVLVDGNGSHIAAYPPHIITKDDLSRVELRLLAQALGSQAIQISGANRLSSGAAYVVFVAPILAPEGDSSAADARALVGRTRLDINPGLAIVRQGLESADDQAQAFLVDADGRIVVHNDPSLLATEWSPDGAVPEEAQGGGEWSAEIRSPSDGTRQLMVTVPVEGLPWSVVVLLPYSEVTGKAMQMAGPAFLALLGLGLGLAITSLVATRSVTGKLRRLTADASRIASGDLTKPVAIPGGDEIDAIASILERLRVLLRGRLDDLSLLLELNRTASSTLDVRQGLAHILEGAISTTQAQVARALLLADDGRIEMAVGRGEVRHGVRQLDRALVQAVGDKRDTFEIEDVSELVPSPSGVGRGDGHIRSAIVVPVRSAGQLTAVIWIGQRVPRRADSEALNVLSNLADQTATLVDTARSFRSTEEERRLLSAILESSSDGILVTDLAGRIVRCSRAVEDLLGMPADALHGRHLRSIRQHPAVADLFSVPLVEGQPASAEVSLPDGRTCACSAFLIFAEDGESLGRVMTLRDITAQRNLEASRSQVVDRVSQETRRPLTLIHGYAQMLARSGSLTDQQRGFVSNILRSVEQTGRLVQGLHELESLEGAVGADRSSVALGTLVKGSAASLDVAARGKGIFLRLGAIDQTASVAGNAAQLRRTVDGLLAEAISAASAGDAVQVSLESDGGVATLSVSTAPSDVGDTTESEPDAHASDSVANAGASLGPALSAIRSIVEGYGGELRTRAGPGGGVKYSLSLPCALSSQGE